MDFFHYDPYAQLLSKIVRGFARDAHDARSFIASGWVDPERFRQLVHQVSDEAFARYPALSRAELEEAVETFLAA